jgi:hypothetical protein
MTQARHRFFGLTGGPVYSRTLIAPIQISGAEKPISFLICDPPKPKLRWLRTIAGLVL